MLRIVERLRRGDPLAGVWVFGTLVLLGGLVPLPDRGGPPLGPTGPDKLLHRLVHAGLAASIAAALAGRGRSRFVAAAVAVVASSAYGAGIEWLQPAVPGRTFEWADVGASALGSGLGALWALHREGPPPRHRDGQRDGYRR